MTQATIAADAAGKSFAIPTGDAVATLKQFMAQSGGQLIYSGAAVEGVRTSAVQGEFTTRAALERMLVGTGLAVTEDEKSGALAVTRAKPPDPTKDSLPTKKEANMKKHHTLFSWVAALFISVGSANLPAQTSSPAAPASSPAPTEEIVITLSPFEVKVDSDRGYLASNSVSATRIFAKIADLPIAINAFTKDFITDQKPFNLYNIITWAPGVVNSQTFPSGSANYSVDGFAAPVERNGFASQARFLDTVNIERVEIVKGPASLLYGQISPGGIINYITKQPQDKYSEEVSVQAGDFSFARATIDVTGPIPSLKNKLAYRLTAAFEEEPRYFINFKGTRFDVSPSLTWQMGDNSKLTLQFEVYNERLHAQPSQIPEIYYSANTPSVPDYYTTLGSFRGPPYPGLPMWYNQSQTGNFNINRSYYFSSDFTTRISDHWSLRLWIDHSNFTQHWVQSGQGGTNLYTATQIPLLPAGQLSSNSIFMRELMQTQEGNNTNYEAALTGDYSYRWIKIKPLIGYSYGTSAYRNRSQTALNSQDPLAWDLSNPATWTYTWPGDTNTIIAANANAVDTRYSAYQWGAFAAVNMSFLHDRLNVLVGERYSKNFQGGTWNNLTNLPTSPNVFTKNWSPETGVMFKVANGLGIYGSYSESFQANNTLLRINNYFGTVPAAPTVAKGYNFGIKTDFLQGRLSSTISYYDIKLTPAAIQTILVGSIQGTSYYTDIQNGAEQSTGMDMDILYSPINAWQIYASYSYGMPKYTSFPSNPLYAGTPAAGETNTVIKNAANVWTKYEFRDGALKGFYIGGGVQRFGPRILANNPQLLADPNPVVQKGAIITFPPYTLVSLMCGYKFDAYGCHWTVDVSGQNLGNQNYIAGSNNRASPRHYVVTVSTKF
jgi:iron complex outermembrane receptor protein